MSSRDFWVIQRRW